jgi:small subunit ribosomal protein S3
MIERKIVNDKFLEFAISTFIKEKLPDVPIKEVTFEKNPLGERITIYTSKPGLVIGREGATIKKLTLTLKERFNFENPQIKIGEVKEAFLSAAIVAKQIANDLANFGSKKFKLTGFKMMTRIMQSGAMGCEIRLSGKLPSSRAKSWRFAEGYIKKTGYISDFVIDKAIDSVTLKTGVVGIRVMIMLPDTPLPDKIEYLDVEKANLEEANIEEVVEENNENPIEISNETLDKKEIKEKKEVKEKLINKKVLNEVENEKT